jgi:hypothetical protein
MFNLLKICLNIYSYFNPYLRKKFIWPPPIKMSSSVPALGGIEPLLNRITLLTFDVELIVSHQM